MEPDQPHKTTECNAGHKQGYQTGLWRNRLAEIRLDCLLGFYSLVLTLLSRGCNGSLASLRCIHSSCTSTITSPR